MGEKQKIILFAILFFFVLYGCQNKNQKQDIVIEKPESKEITSPAPKVETQTNTGNLIVKDTEAEKYSGETVTVTGKVSTVVKRPKVNYLNFGKNYPNQNFSAVIFPDALEEFGELNEYKGKEVEVTGLVSLYNGKPQIIISSQKQIKIIDR